MLRLVGRRLSVGVYRRRPTSLSTPELGREGEYINDMHGLDRQRIDARCSRLAGGAHRARIAARLSG